MTPIAGSRLKRQYLRGFSLLEAIVALVLLTTAGLALFSWINASFTALNRIEENNRRAAAELNAIEYLKTINPMARPGGEVMLGQVAMRWRARALAEPKPNKTDGDTNGPFLVALYEVEVTLVQTPEIPQYSFSVQQMGYERLTTNDDPFGDSPAPNKPKSTNIAPKGAGNSQK